MRFIAYYGPSNIPVYIQKRAVRALVEGRQGVLMHELEDNEREGDFCLGLREAKRLSLKFNATIAAYSLGVLSRNYNLFQDVRQHVPVVVCDLGQLVGGKS